MTISSNIILLVICLLTLTNFSFASSENPFFKKQWTKIASIQVEDMHPEMKKLSEMDIDIAGVDHDAKIIDVIISDYDYRNLVKIGYSLELTTVKGITRGPDQEYKNSEEIADYIKLMHEKYPEITKIISIGKSLEGRDIWAMKISDNPEIKEIQEPAVLFNSMHHAREVMGPEVGWDIIETLLTGYRSDPKITKWVDSTEIWVMPMFNVDGNNMMWTNDSMWRKNTRGGFGVDLNRNYPAGWNKCKGSSGNKHSQTYRGTHPASEPETQAMMAFIKDIRPVFDISYHSYSQLVIYPKGCGNERAETYEVVEKIGKHIGKLLKYKSGTAWELLYNADGGDIDWMYDAYQVIPFVIELNSRWAGFHPKYKKYRNKTVKRNRAGWQYLLERTHQSGVRGVLTLNELAVSNFKVEIYKLGSQRKHFQSYVGHQTGAFHVVLNPGRYELQFVTEEGLVHTEAVEIGTKLTNLTVAL